MRWIPNIGAPKESHGMVFDESNHHVFWEICTVNVNLMNGV